MSDEKVPFLDFITNCFNEEYEKTFSYIRKTKPEEFEKLFMDLREYFIDINLVSFFNQDQVKSLSRLFNNRTGDGLTVSDQVFVSFMENFTNATLTKMKFHYGGDYHFENIVCEHISTSLGTQFNKRVPFYDERFIDGVAINALDIKDLLISCPMLCFYYLVLINLYHTELHRTNLMFGDNFAMQKKRR